MATMMVSRMPCSIPGFPKYSIYPDGTIIGPHGVLAPFPDSYGYPCVNLYNPKIKQFRVHQLVASQYVEPFEGETVNHKDGIKINNSHSNLEWMTFRENCEHATAMGLKDKGVNRYNAKLTDAKVLEIRASSDTISELSRQHGVSRRVVRGVRLGTMWRHVSPSI